MDTSVKDANFICLAHKPGEPEPKKIATKTRRHQGTPGVFIIKKIFLFSRAT
jgi:hypothetical protein